MSEPIAKAHPDEKGIETWLVVLALIGLIQHCKAHPDEKGIETPSGSNREHGTG